MQNFENTTAILGILFESGVNVNKVSNSGRTIFQSASQWNNEKLLIFVFSSSIPLIHFQIDALSFIKST